MAIGVLTPNYAIVASGLSSMPLVTAHGLVAEGHHLAVPLSVCPARNSPDAAGAVRPVRIAGVDRAVGRYCEIVRLVELAERVGLLGLEVCARRGLAGLEDVNLVASEIGDVHPPCAVEAGAAADAAVGKPGELHGLGGAGTELADDTSGTPVVDFQVHDEERAGGVDGGSWCTRRGLSVGDW